MKRTEATHSEDLRKSDNNLTVERSLKMKRSASTTEVTTVIERDRRLAGAPSFGENRIVLHPVPVSCSAGIVAGETWEGRYGKLYQTQATDRDGTPIFVQYFVPTRKVREVQISLPGHTGRTAAEYAMSEAVAIVRSGRRELKRLLLEPTVLFEPHERKITARLMYVYEGAVRVGCARRLAPEEARAIGCPPEILGKVLQQ
jgi:hypothetical protein